jgi:predicted nucleic acid-binding Zn ribbon protein
MNRRLSRASKRLREQRIRDQQVRRAVLMYYGIGAAVLVVVFVVLLLAVI